MKYQIEISSVAEAEADKAFLWLSGVTGSETLVTGIKGY
jgi:hypothetical protein